jgi:serine/threonine-protein kinase
MALSPGTRLGPYEIVAPLGAGGMGEVYRARDTRLDRSVAIKALPPGLAEDPDRRARFEREAKTLASLNHPNIATIYGVEDAGGAPHLVLELVEGETLASRLARGPLEPKKAIELAVQIAAAIEAAHERDIVHRDLKPGNVMLSASGTAKVLDFGLAKTQGPAENGADLSDSPTMTNFAGRTLPGLVLGTAAYMSPEQARGHAVDRRSDVWSFGCILYECLVGRPPFEGATASDLMARILERDPDWRALPAALPARARDVLRRCLQKDSEARPRDIRDVRLVLAEALTTPRGAADGAEARSIAVLPFAHAGGADDEFFADGITEEILNALGHVAGLRVAARSSSFALKGKASDLREVGAKLDVTTVLEGSVRRAGVRLRVTAQLVNVADGYQLWSERYDRELTDVFELQDEIANAIASKLKLSLAPAADRATRGTQSLEAYELFLKGRAALYRRGRYILEAQEYFTRALELDPEYAEALGWLSDTYRLHGTFSVGAPHQMMPRAKACALRALAIDPNVADAYATLADVQAQYERDFVSAEATWRRALELDPRHTRARCERALWMIGAPAGAMSFEESAREICAAVADDPLNAWAIAMRSLLFGVMEKHDESIASAHEAVEVDPNNFFAQWNRMRAYVWAGRHEEALELGPALLVSAGGRHPWTLVLHVVAHAGLGHNEVATAAYEELDARSRWEYVGAAWVAAAAASLGRLDEAMAHARRAIAECDPFVIHAKTMPWWRPLRAHPGFDALVAEIGIVR